ncbi:MULTISPECIES: hypothetical protein [unclassified Streptomyces]|uniref:hypothetical protein n=1 Tax=unclassified Streptomyces TaxID=2593676 RepID=UPI00382542AF
MSTRTKWSIVWAGWVAYFVAAEVAAIRTAEYDAPLTAHMRYALGAKRHPLIRTAGQAALLGGVVWLVDHLYRGIEP